MKKSDGQPRRQVYIDKPVDVQDATGDPVRGWQQLGGFWWARKESLTGRELLNSAGIQGVMDTRFKFRWSIAFEEITPLYRLRYRSRASAPWTIFNIVSVADVRTEHREMEIMAKTGQNEG